MEPNIEKLAEEIEMTYSKSTLVYGFHKKQLMEIEDKGYQLVFYKQDLEYPCMIKKKDHKSSIPCSDPDNAPYRDSQGRAIQFL
jgi:hypothetical protein